MTTPTLATAVPPSSLRHWTLGSSAVLVGVAGAVSSQAATVEIDLAGNSVSMANGTFATSLNLDLTGDGIDDFSGTGLSGAPIHTPEGQGISLQIGSQEARAFYGKKESSWTFSTSSGKVETYQSTFTGFSLKIGSSSFASYEPQELTGFLPVHFTDTRINGGEESHGWLLVRVASTGEDDHLIELVKLLYDDSSTDAPDLYGDDGGVVGDGGEGPMIAYFTRGLLEKHPTSHLLPRAAQAKKKRLRSEIADLENQAAAVERRLAALKRASARAKSSPRMCLIPSRNQASGEAGVLSRKLDGLRKRIRALRQQVRKL